MSLFHHNTRFRQGIFLLGILPVALWLFAGCKAANNVTVLPKGTNVLVVVSSNGAPVSVTNVLGPITITNAGGGLTTNLVTVNVTNVAGTNAPIYVTVTNIVPAASTAPVQVLVDLTNFAKLAPPYSCAGGSCAAGGSCPPPDEKLNTSNLLTVLGVLIALSAYLANVRRDFLTKLTAIDETELEELKGAMTELERIKEDGTKKVEQAKLKEKISEAEKRSKIKTSLMQLGIIDILLIVGSCLLGVYVLRGDLGHWPASGLDFMKFAALWLAVLGGVFMLGLHGVMAWKSIQEYSKVRGISEGFEQGEALTLYLTTRVFSHGLNRYVV